MIRRTVDGYPYEEFIYCYCKCGKTRSKQGSDGRERMFIIGHSSRKILTSIEFIYCACKCGFTRPKYDYDGKVHRFIHGHQSRGRQLTKEHKQKLSKAHTGKKLSEETKRKVGLSSKRNHDQFHPAWKGDNVSYPALHTWIRKNLPKQEFCQICLNVPPVDVACITNVYNRDFVNWLRLCRRCHMIQDGRLKPKIDMN